MTAAEGHEAHESTSPVVVAGFEAEEPSGDGGRPAWRRGLPFDVALVVGAVACGYVVAGVTGALVGGAAMVAGRLPSDRPGAAVAMAGCFLLAGAALATVLEVNPGDEPVSLSFPLRREVASQLAAAAGILLFAAVVTAALAERSAHAAPEPPRSERDRPPRWWRVPAAAAVVGVVAFVVRLVGAPAPLAVGLDPVVASVAAGRTLVVDGVGLVAPAGPVLAALAPGGASGVLVAAGVLLVVLVGLLAARGPGRGRRAGVAVDGGGSLVEALPVLAAGAVAALLPSLWLLDLPAALAGVGAVVAVLLADPRRISTGRAVAAGVVAGLVVLARPDAAVVGPVLLVWLLAPLARRRRPSRRDVRAAWALAGGWLATLACWATVVHGQTGGWNPFVGAGPDVDVARGVGGLGVAVVLLLDLAAVAAAAATVRTLGARALGLLPLVVLPVWAAVVELLAGGEAAQVLSWGAPFVAVLAGWQVGAWCTPTRQGAQGAERTSS
jgi:hypothetical protein